MFAFRRCMLAIITAAVVGSPSILWAGVPFFSHCGQPRCKSCSLVVHVCSSNCNCGQPKARTPITRESATRFEEPRLESAARPQVVQAVPQFTYGMAPMMAMPMPVQMVSQAAYQQPQISRESASRSQCTPTCDQLDKIDEKIEKISEQMSKMTVHISNNTQLIEKLMDRMKRYEDEQAEDIPAPAIQ